ncbi:hypothetical protein [Thaumasiovibrio sp. DFM-14]|uniref:hypothetical protein n=1 Tax=Thaumasiovibrio sp. DFM-14 TaxID=3384792 RepID=UPI00399F6C37
MTQENIKSDLEDILKKSSWWSRFIGSQFVEGLAVFIAQMVYRCEQFARRRLIEGFLSTANRRASILAQAEDRAYVGRKISPSTGTVRFFNKTANRVTVPVLAKLRSKPLLDYVTTEAVEVPPLGVVEVEVKQLALVRIEDKDGVQSADKYQEVILDQALTKQAHQIDVYIKPPNRDAYEKWDRSMMFRFTHERSKSYAEFYRPTEQVGIRFGNGINGMIPVEGSLIRLDVWTTVGDSMLIDGQELDFVGEHSSYSDSLTVISSTPITGGAEGESTEEIRMGALYATAYDEQTVWGGDYKQYISQHIAGINWISVWGEKAQEALVGYQSLDHINKIYIAANDPSKDQETMQADISKLLTDKDEMNKDFVLVTPQEIKYSLRIVGRVDVNGDPVNAEIEIALALDKQFGPQAETLPAELIHKDFWSFIDGMGLLVDFVLEVRDGTDDAERLPIDTLTYLDVSACELEISY